MRIRKTIPKASQTDGFKEALDIVHSLSFPSKMPGTAYGTPANLCVTGANLAQIEGTICNKCYATRGNYRFAAVQAAQLARYNAMVSNPDWTESMIKVLREYHIALPEALRYHRWFDSGDIPNAEVLCNIITIAHQLPYIRFWLPTREVGIVSDVIENWDALPDNLIIRISATKVDGDPHKAFPYTSTVTKGTRTTVYKCPAQTQDNKCGDCRACWDKSFTNITYGYH